MSLRIRFLLMALLMGPLVVEANVENGFQFTFKDNPVQVGFITVVEQGGSNVQSLYGAYSFVFFREYEDSIRLNLGASPLKTDTDDLFYLFDVNFSFVFEPIDLKAWAFELRVGPQFWTEGDDVFSVGLGVHRLFGEKIWGLGHRITTLLALSQPNGNSDERGLFFDFRLGLETRF